MSEFIEVVSKDSKKQIDELVKDLFSIEERIDAINKKSKTAFLPSENKKIIKEINTEIGKSNKLLSETEKFNKKVTQSEEALRFARSKQGKETIKNRQETAKLNKETRSLAGAYAELLQKLSKAEENYRNISASTGKFSNETKKAQEEVLKLRKRIDGINEPIKRFGNNVGNYPKLFGNAARSVRNFTAAFGFTSGIFLLADAVKGAFASIREFDKTLQNISGILRTNRGNLDDLEEVILSVAGSSVNTATDVAKLAESLFTLGKSKDQVKELLKPVNDLSIGLNASADEAGEFLVQMLNSFQQPTSAAGDFADQIATIRTSTSLDFQRMRDSFQFLVPISKILNKDLAFTGSLIGILSDNGIKAERAGRLLGTAQQKLAKEGLSLNDALQQINKASKEGVKEIDLLALASDLLGKQAAGLGIILAQNSAKIDTNAESIRNNSGALDDLVGEQLKSLDASIKILISRWEEYVLNTNKAGGASQDLTKFINFLSKNLTKILNTIIKVGKAFLIYKGVLLATSLISRVYTAGIIALKFAKTALSGGIRKATIEMKAFNLASKANPIGLITSVIAGAIGVWAAFRDGVKESAEALKEAREQANETRKAIVAANIALVKEQLKRIGDTLTSEKDATAAKIKLLQEEIQGRKDGSKLLSEVERERLKKEVEAAKKIADAKKQFEKGVTVEQENAIDRLKRKVKEEIQVERAAIIERNKVRNSAQTKGVKVGDLAGTQETIKELKAILEDLQKEEEKITKKGTEINKDELKKRRKERFELEKLILKDSIATQDAISKDVKNSLVERLVAQKEAEKLRGDLSQKQRDFDISNSEGRAGAILVIEKKFEIESNNITKKGAKARQDILDSDVDKKVKRIKQISDLEKIRLSNELQDLREQLNNKEISEKEFLDAKQKAIKASDKKLLEAQIDFIEKELLAANLSADKRIEIEKKVAELKEQLYTDEEKNIQAIQNAFSALGSEILGLSTDNLANIFVGLKDGFKDAGEAAMAFGQLATDAINKLNQQQQARFEAELQRLDKEKEIALAFAGDSAEARGAIEEDFEERKKRLKEQAAKREKDNAIFSAIINTAAAVVTALAQGGIPLAVAVGLLGAAEIALISSTPIPQFAQGTDSAPGGLSMVNDQKGSKFKEMIRTPKGDVLRPQKRNTLINLPKGSQVYTAAETEAFDSGLNSLLSNNGILPMRESMHNKIVVESNSGISKEEMLSIMQSTIAQMPLNSTNIDKRGITTFAGTASKKIELKNNRVNFRGRKV